MLGTSVHRRNLQCLIRQRFYWKILMTLLTDCILLWSWCPSGQLQFC